MVKTVALVDFSDVTDDLLHVAIRLTPPTQGHLYLVHVASAEPEFVGYDVGPQQVRDSLRRALEGDDDETRSADLHVWSIGPGIYAGEVVLVADSPQPPDFYKALIPPHLNIVHTTMEIHRCPYH